MALERAVGDIKDYLNSKYDPLVCALGPPTKAFLKSTRGNDYDTELYWIKSMPELID